MRLSKTRRERVRQLGRRQFDTGRAVLKTVETSADFDHGFNILIDLHQRRRRSLREAGCFASSRFTNFLREAAERFLDLGRLRLQWVELEGRPVAVELDLSGGETVYHYQSGIDPNIPRERPGWLGTSAALRLALDQGFKTFDFLRGDETYKSHWRAEPCGSVEIRISASTSAARLRHGLWVRKQRFKSWVKGKLPRP